jgi:phosphotransferase system HPr (HPr) family protein
LKKSEVIINAGFDARELARFVQTAGKFLSRVTLNVDGRMINAKSIMGIMSLGLVDGTSVTIEAIGDDAEAAVDELKGFLARA